MKPVMRRLLTRSLAVIPAVIVAAVMGDKAVGQLLVISQVGQRAGSTAWQMQLIRIYIYDVRRLAAWGMGSEQR
jgi:hypothetical protein